MLTLREFLNHYYVNGLYLTRPWWKHWQSNTTSFPLKRAFERAINEAIEMISNDEQVSTKFMQLEASRRNEVVYCVAAGILHSRYENPIIFLP